MISFKKKQFTLAFSVFLIIVLYQKRHAITEILSVFIYAVLFFIILSPLCTSIENKGFSASASAILSLACAVLAIILLFSLFFPYLVIHTGSLLRKIMPVAESISQRTAALLNQTSFYPIQPQSLQQLLPGFSAFAAREGMAAASQAGRFLFSFILSYYLLREKSVISRIILLCFPLDIRQPLLQAAQGCKNALLGYLCGTFKTSVFVFALMYLGLLLLKVENALLLAFFMGIFEVFPYIGPILGAVPILLSTIPQGMQTAVLSLALVFLVQQIESSFAGPYFTASSTAIHPLLSLVSVFILGSIFGLWGIILAVPVVVSCRSLFWSLKKQTSLSEN